MKQTHADPPTTDPLPICTEHRLLLPDGLPSLPPDVRAELVAWLEFHGLDPDRMTSKHPILRNGPWLVWGEVNLSRRAFQLSEMITKCQAKVKPEPFPESVRAYIAGVRQAVRQPLGLTDIPDGA